MRRGLLLGLGSLLIKRRRDGYFVCTSLRREVGLGSRSYSYLAVEQERAWGSERHCLRTLVFQFGVSHVHKICCAMELSSNCIVCFLRLDLDGTDQYQSMQNTKDAWTLRKLTPIPHHQDCNS